MLQFEWYVQKGDTDNSWNVVAGNGDHVAHFTTAVESHHVAAIHNDWLNRLPSMTVTFP